MLLSEARSQLANAALFRALWSPQQLLRAAGLPLRRALSTDGRAGPPLAVAQYLTYACPEKCSFCNVTHAVEDWQKALPDADQAKLVERLAPAVGTWAIGGGEPLAYPSLVDHIGRIRSKGSRVFLVTSAGGIDEAKARALAACEAITVSLHGDAATHDALMGRVGAYDRAVAATGRLLAHRRRPSTVVLNCVLSPENAASAAALVRAGREIGVDRVRFTWLSFMSAAERAAEPRPVTVHPLEPAALDPAAVAAALDCIAALERENADFVELQPKLSPAERAAWWTEGGGVARGCLSLWHTLFLRPDGSVVPCGHLFAEPVGDARVDPLEALWQAEGLRQTRLDQRAAPFPVCRRCCKV